MYMAAARPPLQIMTDVIVKTHGGFRWDVRRLALTHHTNERRILEIRCAVGNISMAFRRFKPTFPRCSRTDVRLSMSQVARMLRDVPTLADLLTGCETSARAGIGAPKNTRAEIIDTLNREINAALADPTIKARFAELGGEVLALSSSEYGKRIAAETRSGPK